MFSCKQVPVFALALLIALLCGATGVALGAAPAIKGISPNNGPVTGGTQVTISGEGFITGSTVKFGVTLGTGVTIESSSQIKVTSPVGSGLAGISVTNANGTSTATPYAQFGYDTAPTALWLGLNGNSSTYLGPVGYFAEREIVYDRGGPTEFTAGELPSGSIETDVEDGMIPVVVIEYEGYDRPNFQFKSDPEFPQKRTGKEIAEGKSTIKTYVHGFVKTALAVLHEAANKDPEAPVLLEPMNEPWGYTTPQYNGAEYAEVIAELLPEAQQAGIPLSDIYVGATGKGWVPAMYKAQVKLETAVQGWYLHPYGPPSGTHEENSAGIQSLPYVQAEMTSGQNNIIVSEVGYCAIDVNEGSHCLPGDTEKSTTAAMHLTEMLNNAKAYHEQGWLKALLVYSRNDGGWAMQIEPKVGTLTKQGEALNAFAESLPHWTIESTPSPAGAKTVALSSVSCGSGTTCMAVGNTEVSPFAEIWNGVKWTLASTVKLSDSKIEDVSCTSIESCVSVGAYSFSSPKETWRRTLVEVWNGAGWTSQTTPNPTGSTNASLNGVSCVSISACAAVGLFYNSSGIMVPLAERWNGIEWALQTTPNLPEGASEASLSSVSCPSVKSCIGVGRYYRAGSLVMLAEAWNGSEWSLQTIPQPKGEGALNAVSCTASDACMAAGWYYSSGFWPLSELWNGSEWTIEKTPNPSGATQGNLLGMSCTSTVACTAVGTYVTKSSGSLPLAERWNGVEWIIRKIPTLGETKGIGLEGVSCLSANVCTAVGYIGFAASENWQTLAASYR